LSPIPDAFNDARIIDSWQRNAAPWSTAVREQQIESRRLVTDQAVLDAVLRGAPSRALDIGCGEGWLSRALSAHGIATTGVDVVPALIDAARAASGGAGEYLVASYEEIVAGAITLQADVVVANFSLIGKEAVDALVRYVPSLLAPGGRFIIQTLHPATARGDFPYVDGWRQGSWSGFSADFTDPAPWYFRTLERWVALIVQSGLRLRELREPVHPITGNPASLLLIADVG
jgi:2-polyprenyl-3-methyl-5-hydroxy-6-metoxy-1,4-benzoquinol methylase